MACKSVGQRLRNIRVALDGIDLAILAVAAFFGLLHASTLTLGLVTAQAQAAFQGEPMLSSDRAVLAPLFGLLVGVLWALPLVARRIARDTAPQRARFALLCAGWAVAVALLPAGLHAVAADGLTPWLQHERSGGQLLVAIVLAALAGWAASRLPPRS